MKKKLTLSFALACILCVTVLAAAAFAASNMLGGRPDGTLSPLTPGATEEPTPTPMPTATLPPLLLPIDAAEEQAGQVTPTPMPTLMPMVMPTPMPTEAPAEYWCTEYGTFYHADENCSGMKNAMRVSAAAAQAMGKLPCPVCVEQSTDAEADGTQPIISVAADLIDCTPHSVIVRAYDPNSRMNGIVNFDAEPMDDTPGGINEIPSSLAVASEVFNHLKLTPCIGDEEPKGDLWRFSIDYTVMDEAEGFHTLRLDFYDYSNLVGYTRLDLPGDAGRTVYVTMPLEDSFALENIYLNVVCRLKRPPTAWQN